MPVLRDVLRTGLNVVFCGSAVGPTSAQVGAYYAGPGNRFWETLYRVQLTPRQLKPDEFGALLDYDIGLTDLAKRRSGTDDHISDSDYDIASFRSKLGKLAPKAVAFNGKRPAGVFLGQSTDYGRQPERIGQAAIFVLPSTSAAARKWWNESHWRQLAKFVQRS